LLKARRSLTGDYFSGKVVLVTEHLPDDDSIYGLVLNKKLAKKVHEVQPLILSKSISLFSGGPLNHNYIQVLHQYPKLFTTNNFIVNNWYLSKLEGKIIAAINNNTIEIKQLRFFAGYSCWDFEQLYNELFIEKCWLIKEFDEKLLALK
jgi:putative transcriptional regulator